MHLWGASKAKNTKANHHTLIGVLRETRGFLARPDNDFTWSSWSNASDAIRLIDNLISRVESGEMPNQSNLEILFAPTGQIQEVSVGSGWGEEFIELASRFDTAVKNVYAT